MIVIFAYLLKEIWVMRLYILPSHHNLILHYNNSLCVCFAVVHMYIPLCAKYPRPLCVCVCYYSPGTFRGQRHPRTCWSWWMREWRPYDSSITVWFYFLWRARRPWCQLSDWAICSRLPQHSCDTDRQKAVSVSDDFIIYSLVVSSCDEWFMT